MASPPDQRLTRLSDSDIYWIRMLNDGRITGAQQDTGRVFIYEPVALIMTDTNCIANPL